MTAVEWLIEKLSEPVLKLSWYRDELYEKAKEMEKQQIIDAVEDCRYGNGNEYYNDTYGSKGSDEEGIMTPENHIDVLCKAISSQTEISDEEIEKGAWENPCLSRQDVYELFDEVFKDKALDGIFKISASKQVRQFKEHLRELAKQKYREQLKNKQ